MESPKVTIVDYGMGNLLSVRRGFEYCGATVMLTCDPKQLLTSDRVVLPGVGAFPSAMQALHRLNLVEPLREIFQRGTPLLGVCLGMQLLLTESEEFGLTTGLGLIPGRVVSLPVKNIVGQTLKVPHIGWSSLQPSVNKGAWDDSILADNQYGDSMYFVHSFMAMPTDGKHCLAECLFGGHSMPAVIRRDQLTGCQFHPEKSGEMGLRILRRFSLL